LDNGKSAHGTQRGGSVAQYFGQPASSPTKLVGASVFLAQAFMDDRPMPIVAGSSEAAQRLMRTIIINF
jgi:hypothetical protein